MTIFIFEGSHTFSTESSARDDEARMTTDHRTEYAVQLGNVFARWQFDHFGVLTFDEDVDGEFALQETKRWVRRIEKLGGGKVWWLASAEIGDQGRLHAHVLTLNTAGLPDSWLADAWHLGRPDVEKCADSGRSARYVVKFAGTPRLIDYRFDLPPLR
ncbi:MAG TPA: hypothetical protein VGQ56_19710 [Gemmatimonadaceae bacterium]|jgi:hypothetical protein|nr:hypothetical protein [Gemmatimonadaceae bacterium]